MNDNVEEAPQVSWLWVLFTAIALFCAIGGASYIAGKLLRGVLT